MDAIPPKYYRDLMAVPYELGGRDDSGADCWGLVEMLLSRFEIEFPSFAGELEITRDAIDRAAGSAWKRIHDDDPKHPLDVIVYRSNVHGWHCGVMLTASEYLTTNVLGVHTETLERPAFDRIETEFWRHVG